MRYFCLIVFLVLQPIEKSLAAGTFFISKNGDLRSGANCDQQGDWLSLADIVESNCLSRGGTIYFRAGDYLSSGHAFGPNNKDGLGRIRLVGSKEYPVVIAPDPMSVSPGKWPVKFSGKFLIGGSHFLRIENIEFSGEIAQAEKHSVLGIGGASHINLQGVYVHGVVSAEKERDYRLPGDCIKIDGGDAPTHNILISKSEISHCNEDAVDVTGRSAVRLIGNEIHHARIIQIKGGAEDILLEDNLIRDMKYGVRSGGMDCSRDLKKYCGNSLHPKLDVIDRFQGDKITIRNNTFKNIKMGQAIMPAGWRRVTISGNRFVNAALVPASFAIQFPDEVLASASAYFDSIAKAYCRRYPEECGECFSSSRECKRVRLKSSLINIYNNTFIFEQASTNKNDSLRVLYLNSKQVADNSTICYYDNVYEKPEGVSLRFYQDGGVGYIKKELENICRSSFKVYK